MSDELIQIQASTEELETKAETLLDAAHEILDAVATLRACVQSAAAAGR